MPLNTDAQTAIHQLNEVGVDTSLSPADLEDFMGNPDFTPYPAIAEALLSILEGGLRKPVFIDVVVFNYEHTPGMSSPRVVEDVDTNVLRKAVLDASAERHGVVAPDFESLLR